jgi:hypothetical protein
MEGFDLIATVKAVQPMGQFQQLRREEGNLPQLPTDRLDLVDIEGALTGLKGHHEAQYLQLPERNLDGRT